MMLCFFFNDTATTEIYTLSLHDALPISNRENRRIIAALASRIPELEPPRDEPEAPESAGETAGTAEPWSATDRKSTRLNSSHANISYAVFCLKKKRMRLKTTT